MMAEFTLRGSMLAASLLLAAVPARADPPTGSGGATPATQQPTVGTPAPVQGLSFMPDVGVVLRSGDFSLTTWAFAERLFDPSGPDSWRRFRQGAEIDLPRFGGSNLRPVVFYEFDLVNSDFFRIKPFRRGFENLFVALQDADDPGKFRILIGENTQILSRDDNLSSGNLPTINRSLILEEHGSTNSFGTQFGIQLQKRMSDALTLQVSTQDGRGSLNTDHPRYAIGNSFSAKAILTPKIDPKDARKLSLGLAVDRTGNITNRSFTLGTAIALAPIGGVAATGDRFTVEADAACTFPLAGHPTTVEGEFIRSRFSGSRSDFYGGYTMAQYSVFDTPKAGDLDVFARYDLVSMGSDAITRRATQQALRTGFNYNLPYANKLASLHLEYGRTWVNGPAEIVTSNRPTDEFRIGLRISLQQYVRH